MSSGIARAGWVSFSWMATYRTDMFLVWNSPTLPWHKGNIAYDSFEAWIPWVKIQPQLIQHLLFLYRPLLFPSHFSRGLCPLPHICTGKMKMLLPNIPNYVKEEEQALIQNQKHNHANWFPSSKGFPWIEGCPPLPEISSLLLQTADLWLISQEQHFGLRQEGRIEKILLH